MTPLDPTALARLFTEARTHNAWLAKPVPDALLEQLVGLMAWGPTSANCQPVRLVFVRSADAKARLKPCLMAGNVDKTMAAPVTAIVGMDLDFAEQLPRWFPHTDARSWFVGNEPLIEATAFRNSSLQGAYLMMAARALGLDVGPMSGFDAAAVQQAFFADQPRVRVNFLCNLGYGDPAGLHPRSPRPAFADLAWVV